jgi:hypothetical protein
LVVKSIWHLAKELVSTIIVLEIFASSWNNRNDLLFHF